MHALIVRAHHEPRSFCSALADRAAAALEKAGHSVEVSDLATTGFDPVSDRRNFTAAKDPDYLKQQAEEIHASETGSFAPEIEAEMEKLERADLLIFSFPLWWFGMPALLKGWVDRVLAMGRIYGGGKWYENGVGGGTGRAMVLMTTGGPESMYSGRGLNPSMEELLTPIHHGVFWFNGFRPLDPFIAWGPARMTDDQRGGVLEDLEARLGRIMDEEPRSLLRADECGRDFVDTKKRFQVTLIQRGGELSSPGRRAEDAVFASWRRSGLLLGASRSVPGVLPRRSHLTFRAGTREEVEAAVSDHTGLEVDKILIEEIETLH